MSKQLAISSSASIMAMAAMAVFMAPASNMSPARLNQQGATVEAAAPVLDRIAPALFDLIG